MKRLIAIDPGLDLVALAVFDYDGSRPWAAATADAKMGAFKEFGEIKTPPGHPIEKRLAWIDEELRAMYRELDPTHIVIERPAVGGAYARAGRGGKNLYAADMDSFHLALGVIIAASVFHNGLRNMELYKASSRGKKADRIAFTKELYGKVHPEAKMRLTADRADAVFVGLAVTWPTE